MVHKEVKFNLKRDMTSFRRELFNRFSEVCISVSDIEELAVVLEDNTSLYLEAHIYERVAGPV